MNTKKIIGIIYTIILMLFIILKCINIYSENKILNLEKHVNINEKFTLLINQKASINIDNQKMIIKLKKIVDSRCPKDAQCIWQGEYNITIEINEIEYMLGSVMNSTENIKETKYKISYISEYELNRATFIVELK